MNLLAIETSTEACSAALLVNDQILERYQVAPRQHGELILSMAHSLLQEAGLTLNDLDTIAFARGPGSFTGVRIAVSVTQGLAYGMDLPVIPVSTLAVLAEGARQELGAGHVAVAIDARMQEIYFGAYDCTAGRPDLLGDERVISPHAITLPDGEGWVGIGTGWGAYAQSMAHACQGRVLQWHGETLPRAKYVALLGSLAWRRNLMVTAEQALPVYLRDRVV
ncbi:MAG: tRNA (adenosine(37)-N6)-threonylcarbamoyltransferase complex dimerization subunit type 1 TsaB [Gammaproteobacteria bacterium RBG_16_57_12]|nr:MAG: tRNA (adenosine(37)-N6)-threonylcarbamoyltransferase complex dimerization subunit type 1 TsaB [Gammaproteobacteria bacterium RBG_16_57_12]